MGHVLVTNDFPPKVGGIQKYLWELWRRLPPGEVTVLTARQRSGDAWDLTQPFGVRRVAETVLLPTRAVCDHIQKVAADAGAGLVVLDPALPLGLVGPRLRLPYAVVLHGAEVTVPARLPVSRRLLGRVLRGAVGIVAAGTYPAAEAAAAVGGAHRLPDTIQIPPGVDLERFRPLDAEARSATRQRLALPPTGPLVVSASRLVPRKGMDVLIEATTSLLPHRPDLVLAIAGGGRDARRLRTLAWRHGVKARFLGRLPDADLADLYATADVFAMLCRDRWGGLEAEGFGMVFLEAAAAGVPQVAGASGGATEAVVDGETGVLVNDPRQPAAAAVAIARLLDDDVLRDRMGRAARARAEQMFSWDVLAGRLLGALHRWGS